MRQFFFGIAVLAAMMFCGDVLAISGDISHAVHHFVLATAAIPCPCSNLHKPDKGW
jgi:hypothetical protein